jgi:transposase
VLQEILTFPLVLATNLASADLLRAYQGQSTVELGFRRAENPAAVAPVFLETPTRIAALGCVYVMALLVYTLVERHVRKGLAEQGETLPDCAPSQPPTARTRFHLMRHIAVVSLQWAGRSPRPVATLNPHQLHVIRLLGDEPSIFALLRRKSG